MKLEKETPDWVYRDDYYTAYLYGKRDRLKYMLMGMIAAAALLVILYEFGGGADCMLEKAEAASAQTTVTVVIDDEISSHNAQVWAEVPCNEVNCPESEPIVGEITLWQRITGWWNGLWK